MDLKQKINSMKNIFINKIISTQQKQSHRPGIKTQYENTKKAYVYEEYVNILKNSPKTKIKIAPPYSRLMVKNKYYKRKNISLAEAKVFSVQKIKEPLEILNEPQTSLRKPFTYRKSNEIYGLFPERSLSETNSGEKFNVNKRNIINYGQINFRNRNKMSKSNENIKEKYNISNGNSINATNNNRVINFKKNEQKLQKYNYSNLVDKKKKNDINNKNNKDMALNKIIKNIINNNNDKKYLNSQSHKNIIIDINCNNKFKSNKKMQLNNNFQKQSTDNSNQKFRNEFINSNPNYNNYVNGAENSFNPKSYNNTYFNNSENNINKNENFLRQKKILNLKQELNNLSMYKENKINNLNNEDLSHLAYLNLKMQEISEKDLYEQSAILIQSTFRGHLKRKFFDDLLYFFPRLSRASDIIENLFLSFFFKKIVIYYHKIKRKLIFKKNIYRSCKNMNLNILHKEISDSFNIINKKLKKCQITQTEWKDIEYKKKYDDNFKVLKRVKEENYNLKDIYNKNKENEAEMKKLLNEIKRKQNVIDIVMTDNQNLAKKIKNFEEKKICSLLIVKVNNLYFMNEKQKTGNLNRFLIYFIKNSIKWKLKEYFNQMMYGIYLKNEEKKFQNEIQKFKLYKIIEKKITIEKISLNSYFQKFYFKGVFFDKNEKQKIFNNNSKQLNCLNMLNILNYKKKQKLFFYFNKFYHAINNNFTKKNDTLDSKEQKLKLILNLIDGKAKAINLIKLKNLFIKWNLMNKIILMKNQIYEKKRKKRQKQRLKKKYENRLLNKIKLSNTNKEKYMGICDKHSTTTDFSNNEMKSDNKNDIIKATEKLNNLFIKAAFNYRLINSDKIKNSNTMRKSKSNNNINDENEEDEDSGESFGI